MKQYNTNYQKEEKKGGHYALTIFGNALLLIFYFHA